MVPHLNKISVSSPATAENDPRLEHWLKRDAETLDSLKVVIVGFPSDDGVKRNGGRTGASEGPECIREQLYRMTPNAESYQSFVELLEGSADIGDVEITGEVETDQENLGRVVAGYLEQQIVPVLLGGGHETAFGHFMGYAEAGFPTSIFNLDAHTDVRPLKKTGAHSGSPFRQALEHESRCAETYLAAGLQPHSVAREHLEYIKDHAGRCLFRDETNITSISSLFHEHESERLMVTFDMDAVDQSFAPGVSAPCANGLPADLWLTAAYLAGRNEQVTSFELSEVNPRYDRDEQTARLAALTIWHFLTGLSERQAR